MFENFDSIKQFVKIEKRLLIKGIFIQLFARHDSFDKKLSIRTHNATLQNYKI